MSLALSGLGAAWEGWLRSAWFLLEVFIGFSAVIFFHELGHFLMAKWCKVRVDRFAIGFGKELAGFSRGETRYSLNALPFGGYVKMLGQDDFVVDAKGELQFRDDPRSYAKKPVRQRMVIVSGGVLANVILGILVFAVVFMVGMESSPAMLGEVLYDYPAYKAGLRTGDVIKEINGRNVDTFDDITYAVVLSDPDRPITMDLERGGQPISVTLNAVEDPEQKVRQIGISPPFTRRVLAGPSVSANPDAPRDGDVVEAIRDPLSGEFRPVADPAEIFRGIAEWQGRWVELKVTRPSKENNEDSIRQQAIVRVRGEPLFLPKSRTPGEHGPRELLGFRPRTQVMFVPPDSPAERAGFQAGDIIVRWEDIEAPTPEEIIRSVQASLDRDLTAWVRRPGRGALGISAQAITAIQQHAVQITRLCQSEGPQPAWQRVIELAEPHLLAGQTTDQLRADLQRAAVDPHGIRKWLFELDKLRLVVRPTQSFSEWVQRRAANLGYMGLDSREADLPVVADVVPGSLAGELHLPRGVTFSSVAGQPVADWLDVVHAFKVAAGQTVEVVLHNGLDEFRGELSVPPAPSQEANPPIPLQAQIVRIAGKNAVELNGERVVLPHELAVCELLREHVGQTVKIGYRFAEQEHTSQLAVRQGCTDPWLMRIDFMPNLATYPMTTVIRRSNPISAIWLGMRKTVQNIRIAYLILQRLFVERSLGVKNISGPVGIAKIGTRIAEKGIVELMFFFGFLSINLAVINFLPLPILDGGHMVFLIIERLKGSPVSMKIQVITQMVGFVLIISVLLFVTVQDLLR